MGFSFLRKHVMISLSIAGLGTRSSSTPRFQSPALDSYQVHEYILAMKEGTIASLREGYGFIKIEGAEKDLFFHANELIDVRFDDLREGDKVTFEIGESPKGQNAIKVSKV